jgi:hypothetical protein
MAKSAERLIIGFIDDLPDLLNARTRNQDAIAKALKVTTAHEEKSRITDPEESPCAKAIKAFLAKRGRSRN